MKRILIDSKQPQFKANLHCHSNYSDGQNSPEEIKEAYRQRGYSIVAFTDHDILYDQSRLTDETFLALNGYEVATETEDFINIPQHELPNDCEYNSNFYRYYYQKRAHFNLIAKSPTIDTQICYNPKHNCCATLKPKDVKSIPPFHERRHTTEDFNYVIEQANKNGFLVAYNHPKWSLHKIDDYIGLRGIFAVEWHNGASDSNGLHENTDAYDDFLLTDNRIFTIATDDTHSLNPHHAFQGWTWILAEKLDYPSIISALEKGSFYSSQGPKIISAWLEDKTLHVETLGGVSLFIIARTRERFGIYEYTKKDDVTCFSVNLKHIASPFFRFEVVDEQGKKACSNAVFDF